MNRWLEHVTPIAACSPVKIIENRTLGTRLAACLRTTRGYTVRVTILVQFNNSDRFGIFYVVTCSSSSRPFLCALVRPISGVVFPSVLHECKNEYRYTGDHVVGWAYQMVVALDYIHSKEMLHRDIKPSK